MKKAKMTVGSYWEAFRVGFGFKEIDGVKSSLSGAWIATFSSLAVAVVLAIAKVGAHDFSHGVDMVSIVLDMVLVRFLLPIVLCIALQVFIYGKLGILGFPKVVREMKDGRSRNSRAFYEACVNAGIKQPITPAGRARMENVARTLKMSADIDTLMAMYFEGVAHDRKMHDAETALNIALAKDKEIEEKAALDRFLGYSGREKRKQMIRANMPKKPSTSTPSAGSVLYQKEKDWAVAGGIASGIAGAGAGLAVAADVQAKNAQIRANNAAMRPIVSMLDSMSAQRDEAIRMEYESCKKQLERIPVLLMDENENAETLMAKLIITEKIEVSATGTVTVDAKLRTREKLKIMDEVTAAIDGYISAVLTDSRGNRDEIILTLPTYGISETPLTVRAMSTRFTNPNARYTIAYRPQNLWLIER